MDKVAPPPNSSPEEIEAWNAFIKASTNLMNTITKKVRHSPSKSSKQLTDLLAGCEPECEACRPQPPCGLCQREKSPARAESRTLAKSATSVTKTPSKIPTSRVQVKKPGNPPLIEEQGEGEEPAEGEAHTEDEPVTEHEPPAEGEEPAEGVDAPAEEVRAPQKAPSVRATGSAVAPETAQAAGDKHCVSAAMRAKRGEEEEKKGKCGCSRKKKKKAKENIIEEEEEEESEEPPPQEEDEYLCGCGPTPGNTEAMVQEMVNKLANAQQKITELQEELARLQRMDASKRVGPHAGPNPAALYKEIMKVCEGYPSSQHFSPSSRQRLFQTSSPMDPMTTGYANQPNPSASPPCDEQNMDKDDGGSPGIPSASTPMMRSNAMAPPMQSPAGRPGVPSYYPGVQAPCRRTPSGTAGSPLANVPSGYSRSLSPSFENTPNPNYWSRLGEYGSPTPPMQRQMNYPFPRNAPQACPPCDEQNMGRGLGASYGGSPGIPSASTPMMRSNVMAPPMQSPAGRPGVPSYYPGVQAPCRRTPSGTASSPLANVPSGYSRSLSPSFENTPKPPTRRRIICMPPRGSSESCTPETCNNLPM